MLEKYIRRLCMDITRDILKIIFPRKDLLYKIPGKEEI